GFSVERAKKIRGKYNFAEIGTTGNDVTSYQDIGVAPGTYKYRVRAFAGAAYSDYSNEVLVKVEETATIPVCGDGICEPDEIGSCLTDCPTDLLPKGAPCTSGEQCQSGACHPVKFTCK
ncbi:MAG: hypothetical protein ABFR35_02310, partial [Thermodesulfobacteriota bacterium]